jgi:hypothetical protein
LSWIGVLRWTRRTRIEEEDRSEVTTHRAFRAGIAATLLAASILPAAAQVFLPPPVDPNLYPPALPPRKGTAPPPLEFKLRADLPLPGPLPGESPRLVDGTVEIPVHGGVAVAEVAPGVPPKLETRPQDSPPAKTQELASVWLVSPNGAYRYQSLPEGRIVAEKRSRFRRSGWRKKWSLRIAGATLAPPLVLDRRVCYASLADDVTCVRADNGHRLWSSDVEDRVSRRLGLWTGTVEARTEKGEATQVKERLILVVPDGGDALIALDPYDGKRRATYELAAGDGKLASEPLVTAEGIVVVARQGYTPSDAALSLLEIVPGEKSPPPAQPGAVTYNDGRKPGPAAESAVGDP